MATERMMGRVWGWDGSATGIGALAGADPLGFAAGDANVYRYVGNDPEDFNDPEGLKKVKLPTINDTRKFLAQSCEVQDAWDDSFSTKVPHEEGGWIYYNPDTKEYRIKRADPSRLDRYGIDLNAPPEPDPGFILIGDFHTHPHATGQSGAAQQDMDNRKSGPRSLYPGYIIHRTDYCNPGDLKLKDIQPYDGNVRITGNDLDRPFILDDPRAPAP